ncbi:uncharacterized protein LOC120350456 [Nilaparvata lugens]|uniref:uncharacterized protein LOC120350456 n=1 Tax=Nilaparvata lugens TaxID=108931 RepID=UPI00193DD7FA|nr:uncharacterized protein LOC120350456 [Nilaparvata lugens]
MSSEWFVVRVGHALRRTSATLLINAGGTMTQLKRHGGWKSSTVAEGYIEESMGDKIATAHAILNQNSNRNINLDHTANRPMPVLSSNEELPSPTVVARQPQSSSAAMSSAPNTIF